MINTYLMMAGLSAFAVASGDTVSDQTRQSVVAAIGEQLRDGYIYEDRGTALAGSLAEASDSGKFSDAETGEELARAMTLYLYSESEDGHLRVYYGRDWNERRAGRSHTGGADSSFGFKKLEILEGNVGYLDLRGFAGEDARARAEAAMAYLSGVDALIIDLGRNPGGGPFMVRFISAHLFAEPTHLASTFMRGWEAPMERWTLDGVEGTLAGVPVYVLTSGKTFSAAESFTFGLKNNDRVTTVGERTGGGGHFGRIVELGDGFSMFLPHGRTYDPATGKGWEAEGIAADVEVPYEDALATAHRLAREATAER